MSLAVCLLFDREADRTVREIWARLEADGVPTLLSHTHRRHRPHLSYVVALDWDLDRVRAALGALPHRGAPVLSCHGMLVFPRGRAALAVSIDAALAERQARVFSTVEATGAQLHRHYRPGEWLPHISLATRAKEAQLPLVARAVSDALPLQLRVVRAELIDSGTGESWPLDRIPLALAGSHAGGVTLSGTFP